MPDPKDQLVEDRKDKDEKAISDESRSNAIDRVPDPETYMLAARRVSRHGGSSRTWSGWTRAH
jgi:hypothetical protein